MKLNQEMILSLLDLNHFADVRFLNGSFCIERRPTYCDRGNFSVKIEVDSNQQNLYIDGADMFPRYYFDFYCMIKELELWISKNKQGI
jgi:hypothetical protein